MHYPHDQVPKAGIPSPGLMGCWTPILPPQSATERGDSAENPSQPLPLRRGWDGERECNTRPPHLVSHREGRFNRKSFPALTSEGELGWGEGMQHLALALPAKICLAWEKPPLGAALPLGSLDSRALIYSALSPPQTHACGGKGPHKPSPALALFLPLLPQLDFPGVGERYHWSFSLPYSPATWAGINLAPDPTVRGGDQMDWPSRALPPPLQPVSALGGRREAPVGGFSFP